MTRARSCWTDPDLLSEAAKQQSLAKALLFLGVAKNNTMYKKFYARCKEYGIDTSFPDKYVSPFKYPDEEVFCENSIHCNNNIDVKKRALVLGYIQNECLLCGQGPYWNGAALTLQMDHINGVRSDQRPENLRMLCPNCHTQTETYAGRKRVVQEV